MGIIYDQGMNGVVALIVRTEQDDDLLYFVGLDLLAMPQVELFESFLLLHWKLWSVPLLCEIFLPANIARTPVKAIERHNVLSPSHFHFGKKICLHIIEGGRNMIVPHDNHRIKCIYRYSTGNNKPFEKARNS